jgi:peptidoglycan/LPS O-acetylase OafA/YrhL
VDQNGWVYKTFYFGQYGVHLFFIISGMVIPWSLYKNSYKIKNLFSFLAKRLLRLEPPYLVSILLAVAFIYFRRYSPTYDGYAKQITSQQVLLHLGYLVPFFENIKWLNNVYWTLAIEFQYYLTIGLLYFLFVSPKMMVRILGYMILLLAPLIFPTGNLLPFWLPLFGIGIILFLYKSKQIGVPEFVIASIVFITHLFILNSVVSSVIAFGAELIIVYMFSYSNSVMSFFGKFSYSVYLIHAIFGATFVNVLSHYVTESITKFMLVIGGLLVTAISSYLMYLLIEKPSKKLSSKMKYN